MFGETKYKPLMFVPNYNWHFTKPEIYKHYFVIFSSQIRSLPIDIKDRLVFVRELVLKAIDFYKTISDSGLYFDEDSGSSHLFHWLTVLHDYEKKV